MARAFPELSEKEKTQIARRSLHHMGLTIIELCIFPHFRKSWMDSYINIEGLDNLRESLKKDKGAFLLTLHLSNPDMGAMGLSLSGVDLYVISKLFKSKWLNDYWFRVRGQHGTRFIAPEKSSFQVLKALKSNAVVAFVLDQFMGPPVGVRTQFFGHVTGTAAGLATLAERSHAPVVLSYVFRDENYKTHVIIEPEIPFESKETRPMSIQHMTQEYTNQIEKVVRMYPEQWMWIHKRWKVFRD